MATAILTPPNNMIVWHPFPGLIWRKIETGSAYTIPGALVIPGSSEGEVGVAGVGAVNALGWLGYEQAPGLYIDGHARTTAYSTDDKVPVLFGGGGIMATLASGQNLSAGALLTPAANGQLTAAVAMTVTIASGTTTVLSDKAQPDEAVAGAYGAGGQIVGKLMKATNATLGPVWSYI